MIAQLLLSGLVESVLHQNTVKLTVQVNLVSHKLEASFDRVQETLLDDELLNVGDFTAQVLNTLTEPNFGLVSALTCLLWNEHFNLIVELLWCRLKFRFDNGGVKLKKTNIS
jgi:hypothetical protein